MIDKIWYKIKEKINDSESLIYNKKLSENMKVDESIIRHTIEQIYYNYNYYNNIKTIYVEKDEDTEKFDIFCNDLEKIKKVLKLTERFLYD